MKASDITDEQIYQAIDKITSDKEQGLALIWDLWEAFPTFPPKVVRAKLTKMVKKHKIDGCECGKCRGDYKRLG